jgi:protein-L-isoaspartate(D-aspartate) O-methyltransferase
MRWSQSMKSVQVHRAFYASFVVQSAGSSNERLIEAFAAVAREHYVGKGPWPLFVGSGYVTTPSKDPRMLYQDVLVGLAPDRGINNGQPSLHARCLAACLPAHGESVVHIGAGTGYYTAILATLVGSSGSVVAYEIEPDLAKRAGENLAHLSTVSVVPTSATEGPLPRADLIYVNAGATSPPITWLEALNVGGRLIFPLTPNEGFGCMLMVTRRSATSLAAKIVTRAAFIPCIGARDESASKALSRAINTQSPNAVRSLRLGTDADSTAWYVGERWWLSTADVV